MWGDGYIDGEVKDICGDFFGKFLRLVLDNSLRLVD